MRLARRIAVACFALAAACAVTTVAATQWEENAFADAIKRVNPENSLRDQFANRALTEQVWRSTLTERENDWATAFTTVISARSRYPASQVRKCTCYLPENIRGWNGGPPTHNEIVELCWRQCF